MHTYGASIPPPIVNTTDKEERSESIGVATLLLKPLGDTHSVASTRIRS